MQVVWGLVWMGKEDFGRMLPAQLGADGISVWGFDVTEITRFLIAAVQSTHIALKPPTVALRTCMVERNLFCRSRTQVSLLTP